ncbi:MAG TPA: flagellar hook assembly protein FlgD [Gammaproteobacteria bacterium]|nr:flagellar hook assembly protein FlgD [Gammaproteobacteria bacterium]
MIDFPAENGLTGISSRAKAAPSEKPGNELDQSDFIELLVAQVKNQDPTKPMDPSQFMNQLTQSSMVNGINDLRTSFDSLAVKLSSDQSLQAAGLVGKTVLLPGGQGVLANGASVSGQVNLDRDASEVNINIYNSRGEQIRSLPLGANSAGEVLFKWDGFMDDGGVAPQGNYLITAEAVVGGKQQAEEVLLESRIGSISLNQGDDGMPSGTVLNLDNGRSVSLDDVRQIK